MSKKGTPSFVMQRASAVLLVPLAIWFLWSVIAHTGADQAQAREWLSSPLNGILFAALVVIGAVHMRIGMQEIIADYLGSGLRGIALALNWIVVLAVVGGTLWSVYTLSFSG